MRVFVYGTLTDPDRADAVLDDYTYCGPAVLDGCRRVDGTYPTLAPGGRVRGRLLSTAEVEALDAYEGVGEGLYVRVSVPADGGTVETYVGDPDALDAPATWPGDGSFAERVRAYVRNRDVRVVTGDPSESGDYTFTPDGPD